MASDSYQPARRHFLKTTGLALAGASIPAPLEVLAQTAPQQEKTYDVEFQLYDKPYLDARDALMEKGVKDEV